MRATRWVYTELEGIRYGLAFDMRTDASRFIVCRMDARRTPVARGMLDAELVPGEILHVYDHGCERMHPQLEALLVRSYAAVRAQLLAHET